MSDGLELTTDGRRRIAGWANQGNDLAAAILLHQVGDAGWKSRLDRLSQRLTNHLDLTPTQAPDSEAALTKLLPPAAAGRWPAERRLLYELQAACLAVERPTYAADLVEWARGHDVTGAAARTVARALVAGFAGRPPRERPASALLAAARETFDSELPRAHALRDPDGTIRFAVELSDGNLVEGKKGEFSEPQLQAVIDRLFGTTTVARSR